MTRSTVNLLTVMQTTPISAAIYLLLGMVFLLTAFNGHRFEDSLVEVSWHYREGTGTGYSTLLVQRVQNKPLTFQPFLLR